MQEPMPVDGLHSYIIVCCYLDVETSNERIPTYANQSPVYWFTVHLQEQEGSITGRAQGVTWIIDRLYTKSLVCYLYNVPCIPFGCGSKRAITKVWHPYLEAAWNIENLNIILDTANRLWIKTLFIVALHQVPGCFSSLIKLWHWGVHLVIHPTIHPCNGRRAIQREKSRWIAAVCNVLVAPHIMLFSLLSLRSASGCITSLSENIWHIDYVDFQAGDGVHVVAVSSSGRSKFSTLSTVLQLECLEWISFAGMWHSEVIFTKSITSLWSIFTWWSPLTWEWLRFSQRQICWGWRSWGSCIEQLYWGLMQFTASKRW